MLRDFSTHEKYRVGASIYLGNRLISIGWNSKRTHPEQKGSMFRWQHAELSAIIGTNKFDLDKATVYVVRINKTGRRRMAKPCEDCRRILAAAGIRRAVFSNRKGKAEKLKL